MLEDLTTAAFSPTSWPTAYPKGFAVVVVVTPGLGRDHPLIS
ncbi:DEDDh family exonuclease, partial [Streptomyces sp. NPDC006386]